MLMLMFSTTGVPLFVGCWAKLRIIQELWAPFLAVAVGDRDFDLGGN